MAIRYDKKLNQEINKVVANFNSKVSRLERSTRNLLLPERVSIKELKKNVSSRNELRRELAKLSRYSKRGAEETIVTAGGLEISRYELDESIRETRRIKSNLSRQIKRVSNITPTVFGVKQSATYSQMGLEQLSNLKARRQSLEKNLLKLSPSEFVEHLTQLMKNKQKEKYRAEVFKENYIDKMLFNLGYMVDYDKDKLNEIKGKLMTLSDKEFTKLFETDEGIRAIRDYYPETHRQRSAYRSGNIKQMKAIENDIINLFDSLYENIDSMIKDYKK